MIHNISDYANMPATFDFKSYWGSHVQDHQDARHKEHESRKVLRIGCTFCDQNLEHEKHSNQSRRPRAVKNEDGSFKCPHCNSEYKTSRSLEHHIYDYHLKTKRFSCGKCDYKSYTRSCIVSHFSNNHPQERFDVKAIKCKECDTNQELHEHSYEILKNVNERTSWNSNLECFECGVGEFGSNKERIKHYKSEHPGKHIFNCNHCKYGSNYLPNLNNHVDSMHDKREFQCEKCSFKTTWNQLFHRHRRSEHGFFQKNTKYNVRGDGQSYLCQECGYSTFSQADFKRHEKLSSCSLDQKAKILVRRQSKTHYRAIPNGYSQTTIKKYKCNKCDYSTDYPGNVRVHVRAVHERQLEKSSSAPVAVKFKCNQCKEQFDSVTSFKAHKQVKHGEGLKFKCKTCEFETLKADDLKTHLATSNH